MEKKKYGGVKLQSLPAKAQSGLSLDALRESKNLTSNVELKARASELDKRRFQSPLVPN